RRLIVMLASPAARRLRAQLTSPKVAMIQRRPSTSTKATGVVRDRPLFRPRTVSRALGPINPAPANRRPIGLKSETNDGARAGVGGRSPGPSNGWAFIAMLETSRKIQSDD